MLRRGARGVRACHGVAWRRSWICTIVRRSRSFRSTRSGCGAEFGRLNAPLRGCSLTRDGLASCYRSRALRVYVAKLARRSIRPIAVCLRGAPSLPLRRLGRAWAQFGGP
eukprot:6948557-Alexandrium_andersonii.AAC.1